MPITLIEALDGSGNIQATGNTFASLSYANTYFDQRPNAAAWIDLTDDEKNRLLLWAMRRLSALNWIGGLLQENQPLCWPRVAIRPIERTPPSGQSYGGTNYAGLYDLHKRFWPSNEIPAPVINAQCEQALAAHQSTIWTASSPYKRRIIQNSQGLIEYKTGGSDTGVASGLAMVELSGFLMGASQIARA